MAEGKNIKKLGLTIQIIALAFMIYFAYKGLPTMYTMGGLFFVMIGLFLQQYAMKQATKKKS